MTVSTPGIGLERAKSITNKSHAVLAGQSLVRNTFVCFDATTRDEVREGADTVGLRFAGISDGVYSAAEMADILIPDFITCTDAGAALLPGDIAYISTATTVTNSGNVPVGVVLAINIDGVAARVLIKPFLSGLGFGGGGAIQALVNTVAFGNTTNKVMGILPAGAIPIDFLSIVGTVFNSDGTDQINVGTTSGDPDEYLDALDGEATGLLRAGSGGTLPTAALGTAVAVDTTVYGKYTAGGSAATTGLLTFVLFYALA